MHEIKIAQKIIKEAKKQGVKQEIEIEVGELSDIASDELKEALAGLIRWKITAVERKSKVQCACGYVGRAEIIDRGHDYCIFKCPQCGNNPNVLEGGEIKLIGVK